jgi:hypothetical protein
MSDSENDTKSRSGRKIPILKGTSNYQPWKRSLQAYLIQDNLLRAINPVITIADTGTTLPAAEIPVVTSRTKAKAWSIIYLALSDDVQNNLSHQASDPLNPNPSALWTELGKSYGTTTSA